MTRGTRYANEIYHISHQRSTAVIHLVISDCPWHASGMQCTVVGPCWKIFMQCIAPCLLCVYNRQSCARTLANTDIHHPVVASEIMVHQT